MITRENVERFARLYSGYTKSFGCTVIKGEAPKGEKANTRSWTEHQQLTYDRYQQHLDGEGPGLGVIMLRDDDTTCAFGAIDIDDYTVDHLAVEQAVATRGLPLVVIRSKSGGAHLLCFCAQPVPAPILQRKLSEWCALLGYSDKTEVFPKQTARAPAGSDVGNFLNLPYYECDPTGRVALFEGAPLTFEDFLDYAESRLASPEDLGTVAYGAGDPKDKFYEGPPCLQHLLKEGGFVQGTMRDGMFSVGVYLRKRFPDDWDDKLVGYNHVMCDPPLRNDEIQDLIKSLKKKDFSYKCKLPPIHAHCQRKLCLGRKFGVGDVGPQSAGLEITAVTRYQVEGTDDPPTWAMEIAGRRILIDNSTFYERDAFNKACLAAISRVPIHTPPARWLRIVDELAANADVVLTPRETSQTGNLEEWVTAYLAGAKCTAMEQIADAGAFIEEGNVYFRALDLFQFLDVRRVPYKNKQMIYHLLNKLGGETKYTNFKKGGKNVWRVPQPNHVPDLDISDEVPSFVQDTPF